SGALGAHPARLRNVRPQRLGNRPPPQDAPPHPAAHPLQARAPKLRRATRNLLWPRNTTRDASASLRASRRTLAGAPQHEEVIDNPSFGGGRAAAVSKNAQR